MYTEQKHTVAGQCVFILNRNITVACNNVNDFTEFTVHRRKSVN
jgi:hypothetical protein